MTEVRWDITPSCDIHLGEYLRQHGKSYIDIDTEAISSGLTALATSDSTTGNVRFHVAHPDAQQNFTGTPLDLFNVRLGFARKHDDQNVSININFDLDETDEKRLQVTGIHEMRHAVEYFETPKADFDRLLKKEVSDSKKKTAFWSSVVGLMIGGALEVAGAVDKGLQTSDTVIATATGLAAGGIGYRWGADGFARKRLTDLGKKLCEQSEALAYETEGKASQFPQIISIS